MGSAAAISASTWPATPTTVGSAETPACNNRSASRVRACTSGARLVLHLGIANSMEASAVLRRRMFPVLNSSQACSDRPGCGGQADGTPCVGNTSFAGQSWACCAEACIEVLSDPANCGGCNERCAGLGRGLLWGCLHPPRDLRPDLRSSCARSVGVAPDPAVGEIAAAGLVVR